MAEDPAEGYDDQRRPPLDPRLLKYSPSARWYVIFTAVFQAATVVATVVAAFALAGLLAELITDPERRSLAAQSLHLWVLVAAMAVRVALGYLAGRYAHRAAYATIGELRLRAVDRLSDPQHTGPRELLTVRERALTVLLRGLDSLVDYFAGYLPALLATAIITPVVVVVIAMVDLTSAIIVICTLPLIPVFMVLIGLMTRDRTERKLEAMSDQTAQLMDLITGLPTLRALGRAQGPAQRVQNLGQKLRKTTMSALRVAFLSGTALELIATLSVALVAVSIGLRLVHGEMTLYAGVLALILAPEAYLPLRAVGAQFHNSEDGMTAAREVLAFIESDDQTQGGRPEHGDGVDVDLAGTEIVLAEVGVRGRDGWAPRAVTATLRPGRVTVLTGPNGSGKSSVISVVLGLLRPDAGTVSVAGADLNRVNLDRYRSQIAWLPQHPVVLPGTVRENLELFGAPEPDLLEQACHATGFAQVLAEMPRGMETVLGAGGAGLSAGQRQRLALTRVLASAAPLLLLDEPTAHLDADSEDSVLAAIAARADAGATVVMVAHHPVAVGGGDAVIELAAGTGAEPRDETVPEAGEAVDVR
ncbi:ABC transporter permease/ATP-binding protein CydD [Gordonia hirsuta DSM 44140 = NBRC 16056]|uniref:ABC transporter permease/ATP-binding protein CydD n=1 Tax=Gordonia hirsuta DSM 44140 = NBRC 16056 TaxID=1121927 RepID=L7LA17_9ACTN|nr:thiol reductant ABC exporter subunit CydD [Gordonia hirsuta]GAC57960.1 ABC transporter permease/ATP-binding protein CydD [Gordonia hirsuta DSM 44140 = NBRC 16056]